MDEVDQKVVEEVGEETPISTDQNRIGTFRTRIARHLYPPGCVCVAKDSQCITRLRISDCGYVTACVAGLLYDGKSIKISGSHI